MAMAYVTMIDAATQTMHDLTEQITVQIAARSGSGGHGVGSGRMRGNALLQAAKCEGGADWSVSS